MSAQDRRDAEDRASEAVQRRPRLASPASGGGQHIRPVGSLSSDLSPSARETLERERKRAEEALRQAQERHRVLFEKAPVMYVITRDQDGAPVVTDCNKLFLSTLGYTRAEVLGRPLADFYTPPSRARLLEHGGYQRALEGRFAAEERHLLTRDGHTVETILRAVPEIDPDGHTVGTQAMFVDITHRKQAEEALRESEERFHKLVDAGFEGIAIHDRGKILDANQALATMMGYELAELVGMDGLQLVTPECRDLGLQNLLSGYEEPYEGVGLRRDGSTFPIEVWGKAIPYDGRTVRVVAIRDITERKRAEEALRQAEARYRLLFEQAPAMYVITRNEDSAPIISDCNDLFLTTLGYPRAEVLGRPLADFYTPPSRTRLLQHGGYQRALEGRFAGEERQLVARDGHVLETVLRAVPELDDGGHTIGTRAMYVDITERKRAGEALRESEERFRELADSIRDVFFAMDRHLKYTYWNKASEDLTGISAEDAIGKSLHEVFPEVVGTKAEEMYLEVLRSQEPQTFANQYQLGGKDFFFEISAYPSRTGLSVFVKDITERRRAEEALRESEERFRRLCDATIEGIVIHDGREIVDANQALAVMLGHDVSEIIGRDGLEFVAPEFRPLVEQRILSGYEAPYEVLCLRKDGSPFPAEVRGKAIPYDGRTARVTAVRDITERKRAEEALRQAEARYRLLFEQAPAMYVITRNEDSAPIISDCNDLFLATLGYSRAEVLGRPLADFYTPPSRTGLLEHGGYRRALEGRFAGEERQLVTRDGRVVETMLRAVPELDDGGHTIGTRAMYVDITERKRAGEALRESEERFRLIARATSDAIYDCDLVPGRVWWSEGVRTLFGYEPSEVGPDIAWWYDHIHPEDRDRVVASTYRIGGGGGELCVEEYRLRRADGSYAWVVDRGYFRYERNGKPLRMIGGITDVTERKRAEEALRESEKRHRLLAENVTDAIWTADPNLRTIYVSPSVTRLRGYSVEEAMAQTLEEVLTPASLDVAMKVLAEELAAENTGRTDPSRSRTLELEHICKDGSTVWAEVRMTALRDETGRVAEILGVSRDISERRRVQSVLEESERRYRLLAENATDIIWIRDLNLRGIYVNPAVTRVRGYTPEEAMVQTPEEILTPASLELAREALAEELAKEQVEPRDLFWWRILELENICKDGSTVWLEEKVTALRDEDKRIVGILGISRDISERRRAEEALQEAREELDSRVERRMRRGSAYGLTFRELTVLHLVAAGKSDKEIAATLGISTLTASKHLANILRKMGVASRTEAGVRAVREGLLD